MPGSPSFSWPMFRQRLRAFSDTVDWNVAIAFWLFGTSSHLFVRLAVTRLSDPFEHLASGSLRVWKSALPAITLMYLI